MGLYVNLKQASIDNVLDCFKGLIDGLVKNFGFVPTTVYQLWEMDFETKILSQQDFNAEPMKSKAKQMIDSAKKLDRPAPHFSISVEGVISIHSTDGPDVHIVVDVKGTTHPDTRKIYGAVWMHVYNSDREWWLHFIGSGEAQQKNQQQVIKIIEDISLLDINLESIFFAESNVVFCTLERLFHAYFKDYRDFIKQIFDIIEKITPDNVEYEELLLSEPRKKKIESLKRSLTLYKDLELIKVVTNNSVDFSNNYRKYSMSQYADEVYATGNSVVLKSKTMDPVVIRKALTDFIGNFITALDRLITPYDDFVNKAKESFSKVTIEQERGMKTSKLDDYDDHAKHD